MSKILTIKEFFKYLIGFSEQNFHFSINYFNVKNYKSELLRVHVHRFILLYYLLHI